VREQLVTAARERRSVTFPDAVSQKKQIEDLAREVALQSHTNNISVQVDVRGCDVKVTFKGVAIR
jgi:hypothetical protein